MIPLDKLYIGTVEDIMDPEEMGRLRVRVFGVHTDNKIKIPTESLAWSNVMLPVTSPFMSGIGFAPVGIVKGATVLCIPVDEFKQEWYILGTIGGRQTRPSFLGGGFTDPDNVYPLKTEPSDVNVLARGNVIYSQVINDINANTTSDTVDKFGGQDQTPPIDPSKFKDAPWMAFANQELQKKINEKDNPAQIKQYHTNGGGSSRWGGETPWCASFIGWCLYKAGLKGSGSATARSYLKFKTDVLNSNQKIPYGAICVIAGSRGPSSGHVFFCVEDNGTQVRGLGGNQGNKSYDNGGEVNIKSFKRSSILAARWPV